LGSSSRTSGDPTGLVVTAITALLALIVENRLSREAVKECSPRREPWERERAKYQAPKERKKIGSYRWQSRGSPDLQHQGSTAAHNSRNPRRSLRLSRRHYREMRGTALIINGTADHVHMLIRIRPAQAAAEVARVVKSNSSRWAREKWNNCFAWQTGYGAFSVSESNVPAVSRYIAGQEEHHKKRNFQEEYVAFLTKNKIAYDERYIWD
jgi:REP-associated tyrosine transposase